MRRQQKRLTDQSAFTLIEVMITVAVVAILVSLAVPSYLSFILRTNRVEGIDAVMAAMLCQERIYSRLYTYDEGLCTCLDCLPPGATDTGLYVVSIATPTSTATPPSYQQVTITATPQGSQANDPCNVLTLNEKNERTASGADDVKCWKGR
jgi:type IV pilus assembly protein PilE